MVLDGLGGRTIGDVFYKGKTVKESLFSGDFSSPKERKKLFKHSKTLK